MIALPSFNAFSDCFHLLLVFFIVALWYTILAKTHLITITRILINRIQLCDTLHDINHTRNVRFILYCDRGKRENHGYTNL